MGAVHVDGPRPEAQHLWLLPLLPLEHGAARGHLSALGVVLGLELRLCFGLLLIESLRTTALVGLAHGGLANRVGPRLGREYGLVFVQ